MLEKNIILDRVFFIPLGKSRQASRGSSVRYSLFKLFVYVSQQVYKSLFGLSEFTKTRDAFTEAAERATEAVKRGVDIES